MKWQTKTILDKLVNSHKAQLMRHFFRKYKYIFNLNLISFDLAGCVLGVVRLGYICGRLIARHQAIITI